MNEELKHIFSIEINSEYDNKLFKTYTHALKKSASQKLNDETIMDKPYDPGIAWLVYNDVDEKTNIEKTKWWVPVAINAMYNTFFNDDRVAMTYRENTPEDDGRIKRAKYLIGKVWPEGLEQIETFITDILLFEANGLYNNTSSWLFGATLLSYPPNRNTTINMIDFLLHESGHMVLIAKQAFDELLLNPNDTAFSPIRKTHRPLNGILHAVFVCSRVCDGLSRLVTLESELTSEEKEKVIELFNYNFNVYKESLQNLDEVAKYTEIGEYFIQQLREKLIVVENKRPVFLNK